MSSRKLVLGFLLSGLLFTPRVASAEVYQLDSVHSSFGFAVKHLMVSTTKGEFTDYQGSITYDPNDLAKSTAEVEIKVDSINTRNADRDAHLKKADFLDVEKFPLITFKNVQFVKQADGIAIAGDLTIKGVTKKVTLMGQVSGPVNNPFGGTAIGIDAEGAINRQDFGVNFNKQMDNGGAIVADEVILQVHLEGHKAAEAKVEEKKVEVPKVEAIENKVSEVKATVESAVKEMTK